uniref:Uncharacterized protein n=1 Tax=Anopheles atroparvus TaxID=41427 RepID=A0AAG5DPX1_ANOAO
MFYSLNLPCVYDFIRILTASNIETSKSNACFLYDRVDAPNVHQRRRLPARRAGDLGPPAGRPDLRRVHDPAVEHQHRQVPGPLYGKLRVRLSRSPTWPTRRAT